MLLTTVLALPGSPATAEADRDVVVRLGPLEVLGRSANYVEAGLGAFNALDHDDKETEAAAKVELRWGRKL